MPESSGFLVMAVGIISLILILSSGMLIWQFASRGSKQRERSGRIPPNMQIAQPVAQVMAKVRAVLANEAIVGCRWRITYDKPDETRIQARLFGNPVGVEGSVDILVNMLFHRLEPSKTELEWSFVVMSGKALSADRVIDATNAAIRIALGLSSKRFGDTISGAGADGDKQCLSCGKTLVSDFSFCIYCGANAT
jgi:hypothetical protein